MGLSFRLAHSLSASLPGALPMTRLNAGRNYLTLKIDPSRSELMGPIISKRLAAVASELDLKPRLEIKPVKEFQSRDIRTTELFSDAMASLPFLSASA